MFGPVLVSQGSPVAVPAGAKDAEGPVFHQLCFPDGLKPLSISWRNKRTNLIMKEVGSFKDSTLETLCFFHLFPSICFRGSPEPAHCSVQPFQPRSGGTCRRTGMKRRKPKTVPSTGPSLSAGSVRSESAAFGHWLSLVDVGHFLMIRFVFGC